MEAYATCCLLQTMHPPISKTSDILLCTPSHGRASVGRPGSLSTTTLYGPRMLSKRPAGSDGRQRRVARESQGNPCWNPDDDECTECLRQGFIGLYTPIIQFGRYATCSHNKDGGRTHIQSRETIGQENHVTSVKLRPRVNFVPCLEPFPRHVFSINTSSSNTLSLFHKFHCSALFSATLFLFTKGVKRQKMDKPGRHSFLQYTLTMRLFPVSEKPTVSNHKRK